MKNKRFSLSMLALICIGISLSAQSNYKIVNKINLRGEGFWDYIAVDETNGKIYASHSDRVHVVDIATGVQTGVITDIKVVHGIAIAPELNKGFTSNGGDATITVFSLSTLEILANIPGTGQNPDAILYDSFSKRVFAGNGRSASLTVIDAVNNQVAGTVQLEGKPEAIVSDGKGKIYVNIEDKSLIEVINASTLEVLDRWPISPGEEPSGLALDNQTHRLFSVCGNEMMIVVDAETGKVITSLPIGEGCDGAAFDPLYKRAYASNGEGTMTVVEEKDPDNFEVLETVSTQRSARTIAIDKTTHHIYLPAAEYEENPSAEGRRPAVRKDSFGILDIETLK